MKKILAIIVAMLVASAVWAVDKPEKKYESWSSDTIEINENQPIAVGELIFSVKRAWGHAINGEIVSKKGEKNLTNFYQGIKDGKILISRNKYGDSDKYTTKLQIDNKGQAVVDMISLDFYSNQRLLITVVDKENRITVKGI